MTRLERVKRFLKFCDEIVNDGDWEYGDGKSMTNDARSARFVLYEWVKAEEAKKAQQATK